MKKNFAMRIAACLLVVTMLSLCMVSYTYAKYTTGIKGTSSITMIAKWGINLELVTDGNIYDDDKTTDDVVNCSVKNAYFAAPGTHKKIATVKLTGTPDVAYAINVVPAIKLEGWVVGDNEVYCPLVFTVGNEQFQIDDTITTTDALIKAVGEAIETALCEGNHKAGEAIADTAADLEISWTWAFETGNDAKDTELANKGQAKVDVSLTIEVNQLDEYTE